MTKNNTDTTVISRAGKAKMTVVSETTIIEGEGKASIITSSTKGWVVSTPDRMKTMVITIRVVSETKTTRTISTGTITKETTTKGIASLIPTIMINSMGRTTLSMVISILTSIMSNPLGIEVKEGEISITRTTSITIEGITSIVKEGTMGKEEDKITIMIGSMMEETLETKAINRILQITNPIINISPVSKTFKQSHPTTPLNTTIISKAKIEGPFQISTMTTAAMTIIAILVKATETVGTLMMEGTSLEAKEDSTGTEIAISSPKGK
jgi:hypothetical protein